MKICTYKNLNTPGDQRRLGILIDETTIIDPNLCLSLSFEKEGFYNSIDRANHRLPSSLNSLLKVSSNPIEDLNSALETYNKLKKSGDMTLSNNTPIEFKLSDSIKLSAPLDKIETYRDFYAHEKHVKKGFEKRNEEVPPAWYEIPAFYKGATANFIGPDEEIMWPSYTDVLDYELELAVIIGRDGMNIKKSDAKNHIFGYTILNDVSARDIQKKEMSVRLGPSKGKDFCSVIGPVIVTFDEFNYEEPNLKMSAHINGEKWSEGYSNDSHYSFSEMVEFASKEEWVLAGDLMGSGTVGTGCGLELDKWIKSGDQVDLTVEKIGTLSNKIGKKRK